MQLDDFPIVYVEWFDHVADGSWTGTEEPNELAVCFSIGWHVKTYKDRIILFSSASPNHIGNTQVIARKLIKTQRIIQKAKKK